MSIFLQDLGFDYCYLSESFETSVPWSRWVDTHTHTTHAHTRTHTQHTHTHTRTHTHAHTHRVLELCRNVKDRVTRECERHGVDIEKYPPMISAR